MSQTYVLHPVDGATDVSGFHSLARLDQAAMDALPEAMYLCAGDGRVIRFNRKAAELWGRAPRLDDPAELYCGSFRMYLTDGTPLPHDRCPMATALRTGQSFLHQEVVAEQPNGRRLTLLVNISPFKDDNGQVIGAVNCFQDITSRKLSEEGLKENERKIRELIDALPAAIYVTDAEGRITMFNQAAVEFSGRTPNLGSDSWCVSWKLYRTDGTSLPHDQCPMAVALKEGQPVRGVEAIAERPDGSRIYFEPYPTPLRDEAGNVVGAINMLVDITERKRAEEQRQLLLREMNHRAKNFIAVASSLVTLTAKHAQTKEELAGTVRARLDALLTAHELVRPAIIGLDEPRRPTVALEALIGAIFAPYVGPDNEAARLVTSGSEVLVGGKAATGLALLLHELATNAAKYGALAEPEGRVEVSWSVGAGSLKLLWKERGGPRIDQPPELEGFGSQLSRMSICGQLGGELARTWLHEGLQLEVSVPLDNLSD